MRTRAFPAAKFLCAGALALWLVAAWPGQAQAKLLESYDLDSLIYMSDAIVKVEIKAEIKSDPGEIAEVKVLKSYKGELAAEQSIKVMYLWLYSKAVPDKQDWVKEEPLSRAGERLILFLQAEKPEAGKDAPRYSLLASGAKLIAGGKVLDFSQWRDNPGPYLTRPPEMFPKENFLTEEQFEDRLRERAKAMDQLAKDFASDKGKAPEWLLKLLSERAVVKVAPTNGRDHIAELAAARIANGHDPEALDRALKLFIKEGQLVHHGRCVPTLWLGFGTPKGRDYLLKQVADASKPVDERVRWAWTIEDAGGEYHTVNMEIGTHSWKPEKVPGKGNGDYLVRIARLAAENAGDEKLCAALLRTIEGFTVWFAQNRPEPAWSDLKAALPVLEKLANSTKSEETRRKVESITKKIAESK